MGRFWSLFLVLFCFYVFLDKGELIVFYHNITHLRSLHIDNDLPFEACEPLQLQRMVRRIKRYMGEKDRKPKLPITFAILCRLVALHPAPSSIGNLNYIATICLAVPAFLRCGEFTVIKATSFDPAAHLTRSCAIFQPSFGSPRYIMLSLPSSKTDPFCKGISLYISAAPGSPTCPVTCLKRLYLTDPQPPESPLFVGHDGAPLLCVDLLRRLREDLTQLGFQPSQFAGHSFWRGGASSAAAAGFSDFELQQLGRWRSDAYKLYIEPNKDRLLSLSACLHWAIPNA